VSTPNAVLSRLRRPLYASVVVVAFTLVLLATGADLAVAMIGLLLAVTLAALLGYAAAIVAAIEAFLVLSYFFVPPKHSFAVDNVDDLVALVAFLSVAVLVAAMVARLNELLERSELSAREAGVRLRTTDDLLDGVAPETVAPQLCEDLMTLFDLVSCNLMVGSISVARERGTAPVDAVDVAHGPLIVQCGLGRALASHERATLEALVADLGAGFDRVRLADEAAAHRLEAELDRSRAGFLTAMTHDLRTPLATIKAAIGTLIGSPTAPDPETTSELLETSYREVARLEDLVTAVLEFARIRAGALEPERVDVDVGDVVQGAVRRLGVRGAEQPIVLDIDPELPAAFVDALMFERAVANLLDNALRYGGPGRPIDIRAASSRSMIELRVVDLGLGIAVADRERVFDDFVRLDRSNSKGVGLGLAITRAFMAANGGGAWCEETPGGGATFVLAVPAHRSEPAGDDATKPRAMHVHGGET
jgi:two-component system sensor histidine kinase KdpD